MVATFDMNCATQVCVEGKQFTYFWSVKCLGLSKMLTLGFFFSHHKCNKWQTLRDSNTHLALPVYYTFCDLDIISRLKQCQTVLNENFMFYPINLKLLRLLSKYIKQVMNIPLFLNLAHIQGK